MPQPDNPFRQPAQFQAPVSIPALNDGNNLDVAWEIATSYHDIYSSLRHTPQKLAEVRAAAVRAILARARAVIGASKKESKRVTDSLLNRPYAELNIEQTLENIIDKTHLDAADIAVDLKEQKRFDCALMLDTSLSMSGKKLALLSVAAAVLSYRLPSEDFAVISFESTARTIKKIRTTLPIEKLVIKILEVPAMGYTNIEAALNEGLTQLAHGAHKNRVGILLSDGKYTAGDDPIPTAARFRALHVVLLGDFNTDPVACSNLAAAAHGRVYEASSLESLPRVLHKLLSDVLS